MSEPIVVTYSVRVPTHAMSVRAVRASGPGGQNVNKVATKIVLQIDLGAIEGLNSDAQARLAKLARRRLDAAGRLVVTSQVTRNQAKNLEDARDKVRRLVETALRSPRPRRPSTPSPAAKERRMAQKKRRSTLKESRRRTDNS